jgi:hypothetical protein
LIIAGKNTKVIVSFLLFPLFFFTHLKTHPFPVVFSTGEYVTIWSTTAAANPPWGCHDTTASEVIFEQERSHKPSFWQFKVNRSLELAMCKQTRRGLITANITLSELRPSFQKKGEMLTPMSQL